MKELSPTQRRELRARAHHLHPVVAVGNAGLTPAVALEIEANLKSHELIKIRLLGEERAARAGLASEICAATDASEVQTIGKILVLYREKPTEEKKAPKRRKARKAPRKTKRSFQHT